MKIKNPFKNKKYLDFTNDSWKSEIYLGYKIIYRPYKKLILTLSLMLASLSLIIPDLGLGIFAGFKLLMRYG